MEGSLQSFLDGRVNKFKELEAINEKNQWVEEKQKDPNVKFYMKKTTGVSMVRSERLLKCSLESFVKMWKDDKAMIAIDDMKDSRKTFEDNGKTFFLYFKNKGKLVVDPRDCILAYQRVDEGNTTYLVGGSYEHKDYPPATKGCVRAEAELSGFKITKEGDGIRVIQIGHMNPKGNVPSSIINSKLKGMAQFTGKMEEYIKKNNL